MIRAERWLDERGFFARAWCQDEYASHGLAQTMLQANISHNAKRGTLRGMHYQAAPVESAKSVRCIRGSIYDIIIDMRPESLTFRQSLGIELSAASYEMFYVPPGFAHGFQTLEDDTDIFYLESEFYVPDAQLGVRYDDPAFGLKWPLNVEVISDKDKAWPDFGLA